MTPETWVTILIGISSAAIGYAVSSARGIAALREVIAALPGEMTKIARYEAQHKFAQVETMIAFHTESIDELRNDVAALKGRTRDG